MPPLNAPSSPEQSPTKIRANNPCIPAPDGQGYQLEPESTPKKLPKKTTNQKRQTNKKKKNPQEGKLLAGLRPNNAACPVCWQLCSPDTDGRAKLCSPLSTPEELKKNVHSNHTRCALNIRRSHECIRPPLLGAQSFKSEKNELCGFFSKGYLSLRCFLIFQSIYMFILFPGL